MKIDLRIKFRGANFENEGLSPPSLFLFPPLFGHKISLNLLFLSFVPPPFSGNGDEEMVALTLISNQKFCRMSIIELLLCSLMFPLFSFVPLPTVEMRG